MPRQASATFSRRKNERSPGLDLMANICSSPESSSVAGPSNPTTTRGPGMPGILENTTAEPIYFSRDGHHLHATFTPSTNNFTPQPLSRSNSSNSVVPRRASRSSTRLQKNKGKENHVPYTKPKGTRPERIQKTLTMKQRALSIKSTGKLPASEHQRRVMLMVYEEITPYPDEAWISVISVLIKREYHQVKNWFSNQRQKDSRINRENAEQQNSSPTINDLALLQRMDCEGRQLRLRPIAQKCAEVWTDKLFEEIVMIHNFRVLIQLRREQKSTAATIETIIHDI